MADNKNNNIGKVDSKEIAPLPVEYGLADEINSPAPEFSKTPETGPMPPEFEAKGTFARGQGRGGAGAFKKLQKQMTMIGMIAGVIGLSLTGTMFAGLHDIVPILPDETDKDGHTTLTQSPDESDPVIPGETDLTTSPDLTNSPDESTGGRDISDYGMMIPFIREIFQYYSFENYLMLRKCMEEFDGLLLATEKTVLYYDDYDGAEPLSFEPKASCSMIIEYGTGDYNPFNRSYHAPVWFVFAIPRSYTGIESRNYDRVMYIDSRAITILEIGIGDGINSEVSYLFEMYTDGHSGADGELTVRIPTMTEGVLSGGFFAGTVNKYFCPDSLDVTSPSGYIPDIIREGYDQKAVYHLDGTGRLDIGNLPGLAVSDNMSMYEAFTTESVHFGYYYDKARNEITVRSEMLNLKDGESGYGCLPHAVKDGRTDVIFDISVLTELLY